MSPTIHGEVIKPKLPDYEAARRDFSWAQAEAEFSWHETGRHNAAHEALDRWAARPAHAGRTALVWDDGRVVRRYSFAEAAELSCRWAHLLEAAGAAPGARVLTLLEPCPETVWAQVAAARLGAVYCHLRPGLSGAAYRALLGRLRPQVIVCDPHTPAEVWQALHSKCTAVYARGHSPGRARRELAAVELLPLMEAAREPTWVSPSDTLQLAHAESPEGPPNLAASPHQAMVGHKMTARWALNLGPESVLWAEGHSSGAVFATYGVWGAWLCGAASLLAGGEVTPSRRRALLADHGVTTWYTNLWAIRAQMALGDDPEAAGRYPALEHIATVGQRLEMEQFFWVRNNFGRAPHETWWTVETGMICVANLPATDIRLGSIGRPVPGVEAKVLDGYGRPAHLLTVGELSLKAGWPSMTHGYMSPGLSPRLHLFDGRWLRTGDMAVYDEEGYLYLQGRRDDLIRGHGRMVGPYEVEYALTADPRVSEAAAVVSALSDGQPALRAYVVLEQGETLRPGLRRELLAMLVESVSPDGPLSGLEILDALPRNEQGKLLRRALRALDLGLPIGDVTALKAI